MRMRHIQRRIDPQDPVGSPEIIDSATGINQCNSNKCKIDYNKLTTGNNNPTITKSKQLSQYIRTTRHTKYYPSPYGYLDERGLIYTPFTKVHIVPLSTFIQNDIIFPRDKIYITAIQRNVP
jgi:hypothetical protein